VEQFEGNIMTGRCRTMSPFMVMLLRRALPSLLLSFAVTLSASSVRAGWVGPETPLDARRRTLILETDARHKLKGEDPNAPKPNQTIQLSEHYYYEKVLAVLALVEMGEAPETRVDEANQLLRWALFAGWPANGSNDMIGQYAAAWAHRSKALALRLYVLFADRLDSDIRAEMEQRLDWLIADPQTSSSENIKLNNNVGIFLAHEIRKKQSAPSFSAVRDWLANQLAHQVERGQDEWGSNYHAWSLGAVLTLADFAADDQIRTLATLVIDSYLARAAGFTLNGSVGTGAHRRYPFVTFGYHTSQTTIAQTLFSGNPASGWMSQWVEWGVSNYRPLALVHELYLDTSPHEGRITVGGARDWRHYVKRGVDVALAVNQSPNPDHFVLPSGGTHDISGVYIWSTAGPRSHVAPTGYVPNSGPKKRRNLVERYFGIHNVAFAHNGGTIKAVWASGSVQNVPIRLFRTPDFSRELSSGWAFLQSGSAYVAWAPTLGDPKDDPETATFSDHKHGSWLRSSHVPGDAGELAVFEVGDAASFGSYAAFKQEILTRNQRPRWVGGKLVYKVRNGTTVELSATDVKLDGKLWDPASHPAADSLGLSGDTVTTPNGSVTFDADAPALLGKGARVPAGLVFGSPADVPPNPECSDGADNDGDGLVDGDDPDCAGSWDDSESSGAATGGTGGDGPGGSANGTGGTGADRTGSGGTAGTQSGAEPSDGDLSGACACTLPGAPRRSAASALGLATLAAVWLLRRSRRSYERHRRRSRAGGVGPDE
jgi:hypothetical protein